MVLSELATARDHTPINCVVRRKHHAKNTMLLSELQQITRDDFELLKAGGVKTVADALDSTTLVAQLPHWGQDDLLQLKRDCFVFQHIKHLSTSNWNAVKTCTDITGLAELAAASPDYIKSQIYTLDTTLRKRPSINQVTGWVTQAKGVIDAP